EARVEVPWPATVYRRPASVDRGPHRAAACTTLYNVRREDWTMPDAFICDAARTPIGRYAGALAPVRPDDLAAIPMRALVGRHPKVDWARVDDVILGCANQAGEDNRNVARMATLL